MNEKLEKILHITIACCFAFSIAFGGIQTCRLERSMAECRQYREQLELAADRESEVRTAINRTSLILSETTNSIGDLRKKLQEVEDSYNYLWNLFYNNDNTICSGEN